MPKSSQPWGQSESLCFGQQTLLQVVLKHLTQVIPDTVLQEIWSFRNNHRSLMLCVEQQQPLTNEIQSINCLHALFAPSLHVSLINFDKFVFRFLFWIIFRRLEMCRNPLESSECNERNYVVDMFFSCFCLSVVSWPHGFISWPLGRGPDLHFERQRAKTHSSPPLKEFDWAELFCCCEFDRPPNLSCEERLSVYL